MLAGSSCTQTISVPGMLVERGLHLVFGPGVELFEEDNSNRAVLAPLALHAQGVADLAGADQQPAWRADRAVGQDIAEAWHGKIRERGGSIRAAQHALGREDNQRFAPRAHRLAAQQMEVLRGGGRLADLHVVVGGELQVALDARAGVLRPLALVAVGQQQDKAGEQVPLGLAGRDELVDDDLRAVGEVAELRLPQHQRLGIVARVAVLEAQHSGLRQHGVIDLEAGLLRAEMLQRNIAVFILDVDQTRRGAD